MSIDNDLSAGESAIQISNVWKIFGDRADEALRAIREEGLGKAEVLETYNAVVGVASLKAFTSFVRLLQLCPWLQNQIE